MNKDITYHFPAEWEPQEAVWFAWTTRQDLWKGYLDIVQNQFIQLYRFCSNFQKVNILCSDTAQSNLIKLLDLKNPKYEITVHAYETDDVWIRDYGPIFLKDKSSGSLLSTDWIFNAWGAKYDLFKKDNAVPKWISNYLNIKNIDYPYILEGGAIDANGQGILCTTNSVLKNLNRNLKDQDINWDDILCKALGIETILWFKKGLHNDDTDGHIDNVLRFAPNNKILYAIETNQKSPNFDSLKEIEDLLNFYKKGALKGYKFQALPVPDPIFVDGAQVSASYTNYLILNGAVIVPSFGQEKDKEALSIIKACFPDREAFGFDCLEIIREGGGLHCMSLNQPLAN